jgi:precorrin-2 dehydrogenase/sirohydrochlorin ferrochelatase
MAYYPINVDLKDRLCIVVGGGKVAERKVQGLLICDAKIAVISPHVTDNLAVLADETKIIWYEKDFQQGDLKEAFLVIAATDDESVQEQVFEEAERLHLLINVADVPKRCNFILPATVRRGDLAVSISTGGKSPALAKQLRMELEKRFGPEYKILINILGKLREEILSVGRPQKENELLFHELLHQDMIHWVKNREWEKIKDHFKNILGEDIPDDWLENIISLKH